MRGGLRQASEKLLDILELRPTAEVLKERTTDLAKMMNQLIITAGCWAEICRARQCPSDGSDPVPITPSDHRKYAEFAEVGHAKFVNAATRLRDWLLRLRREIGHSTPPGPETLLGQIGALLASEKRGNTGKLKLPAETILEAIRTRPYSVKMHGDSSGVRRRLVYLDTEYPGIRDCFVISGNTLTFSLERFREKAPTWAKSQAESRA